MVAGILSIRLINNESSIINSSRDKKFEEIQNRPTLYN